MSLKASQYHQSRCFIFKRDQHLDNKLDEHIRLAHNKLLCTAHMKLIDRAINDQLPMIRNFVDYTPIT